MKFYDPFKVQGRNGSVLLALCLIVMMCIAIATIITFIILHFSYFAVVLHTVAVLAISRVVYAVIKGD